MLIEFKPHMNKDLKQIMKHPVDGFTNGIWKNQEKTL